METRTLRMKDLETMSDGAFTLKGELPKDFDTRFIKKSISEHDSFPLYAKSAVGKSPTVPIATVSLAILDDHSLKVSGRMNDRDSYYLEIMKTWTMLDLRIEIDAVKQKEARLNRLVLDIGY